VPLERAMRNLELNEGLRVTEVDISLSADTDFNDKRAAEPGQRLMRFFAIFLWEVSEG
jgi:hypothetical protein